MIDTSLDYAIHAVNGLSKKDMQNVVTHINEVLDMEQATTIQKLEARVQELEFAIQGHDNGNYDWGDVLAVLERGKAKLREGEDD